MQDAVCVRIPLRRRDGSVAAHALVDAADAHVAELRWSFDRDGYVVRKVWEGDKCRTVSLARVLLGLKRGDSRKADHINRDKLDNRRGNLRVATDAESAQNKGSYRGSSSAYRGVYWHADSQKWKAAVRLNGRKHYLGAFDDEAEAAEVARAFRAVHMPYSNEDRVAA